MNRKMTRFAFGAKWGCFNARGFTVGAPLIKMILAVHTYSFVMVSSRLSSTRETAVHAPQSTGVTLPGSFAF